jgi:colicin import membrane protein
MYGAPMEDRKESSVLFNLKELMNLEEDRIKTEEDQKKKAAEDARRREEEMRRAAEEAEKQRIRLVEEERQAAERRAREEEARRHGIIEAEKERARLDSEARARQEEQERMLSHQREMERIAADKAKGVSPGIIVAIVMVLLGAAGGVWFGVVKPQQEQAAAERLKTQQEITAQREAREAAERLAESRAADARRLAAEAAAAAEATRLKAEADRQRPVAVPPNQDGPSHAGPGKSRPSKPARPSGGTDKPKSGGGACDPNDPLCGL